MFSANFYKLFHLISIFVVMGVGGAAVLGIWTHGLTNPEVHILKGDRGTLDYVENDHDANTSWGSHRGDSHLRRA